MAQYANYAVQCYPMALVAAGKPGEHHHNLGTRVSMGWNRKYWDILDQLDRFPSSISGFDPSLSGIGADPTAGSAYPRQTWNLAGLLYTRPGDSP